MKSKILTGVVAAVCVCAMIAGVSAYAQRGGGQGPGGPPPGAGKDVQGPPPMRGPGTSAVAGATGLFVQAGPSLVKYDPATLEQVGTIELAQAPTSADAKRPPMRCEMILAKAGDGSEQILMVIGDEFVRIDAAAFAVAVRTALPALEAPDGVDASAGAPPPPPATMKLSGDTLYLIRAYQILAVSITDGQVIAQGTMPVPPSPPGG